MAGRLQRAQLGGDRVRGRHLLRQVTLQQPEDLVRGVDAGGRARQTTERARVHQRRPLTHAAGSEHGREHGGAHQGRPHESQRRWVLEGAPNLITVIRLDAATVLLQWATGGLAFTWVTTRHREVGLGYGWLMRGIYAVMAAGALACGAAFGVVEARETAAAGVVAATLFALAVSWLRRGAGVSGQRAEHDRRTARVAAMTGIDRANPPVAVDEEATPSPGPREFPPGLDLVAPVIGALGLVGGRAGGRRRRRGADDRSPAGRRGLPRFDHRRHAPRPLVPGAAGPAPPPAQRARAGHHDRLADRGGPAAGPPGHGPGPQRHDRRRLGRRAGLVLGGLRA